VERTEEIAVSLEIVSALEAIKRMKLPLGEPQACSCIIDARSEAEYALDHLPGAINWPSLNNQERIEVGTLYKQVNAFEASKLGAAMVARNVARHIENHVMKLPKTWQPLIYCWRGGKRSGSLALVLSQIGFKVQLIEGGYKAFRHALLETMPLRVAPLSWRVICGPTGSGKTRLIQHIREAGGQVLDLEALANHRSSVLGLIPGQEQPTQKHFDTLIWHALGNFDASQPVFVEAESKKVGNVSVPESLITAMRSSPCVNIDLSLDERVELLLEDYGFFKTEPEFFCQRLQALKELRGRELVDQWCDWIRSGQMHRVVSDLLQVHYDPSYHSSLQRNFKQSASATSFKIGHRSELKTLAQQLMLTSGESQIISN
jgi:tRNA 2-selenouridine synthase